MDKKTKLPEELLGDSEATLRLVDALLDDLREGDEIVQDESERIAGVIENVSTSPSALAQLPEILLRAYSEIRGALETLRRSRGVLEKATLERIQRTQENLQEVSSATEKAATDMLDGLDRALLLIDRLDSTADSALEGDGDEQDASEIRTELRDELFHLISSLQFQDITSQQLRYASGVLAEIESRLVSIADLFDVGLSELDSPAGQDVEELTGAEEGPVARPDDDTYDPAATMLDPESRQALADEIFTTPGTSDD